MSMLPVGFGASGDYTIEESLRFNASQSSYLSWTPASAGNRKTWTWSGWMKRGKEHYSLLFAAGNTPDIWNIGTNCTVIGYWVNTNQLVVYNNGTVFRQTAQVMRDPSAWYHIVVAFDTTQATAADRLRVYINGVEVTSWDTNAAPTQNLDMAVNVSQNHFIGGQATNVANAYFDGYLTEINFIDGQALDPSSFGEFDATTGVWKPKGYTGTYGTNGFYLPMKLDNTVEGFNTVTYWGNNSTQKISGVGFSPDLVWIKSRNISGANHVLVDSVRGVNKFLLSNLTDSEVSVANTLTSFDSDGFSLGNTAYDFNITGNNYVAWCWDAGSSTVSNTDGSITSSVRANPTYGFSVVSYTGTGANATVGHGLGTAPSMVILKNRSVAASWMTYHAAIGNTAAVFLNTTLATITSNTYFNNTSPTSTVFSVGDATSGNGSGNSIIAYCFSEVSGYSKFGSYTGTGASGNVVTTGFKPAMVILKRSTGIEHWQLFDNTRDVDSEIQKVLYPNLSDAEYTWGSAPIKFTDTGFELLNSDVAMNGGSDTYIYMAFKDTREYAFWLDDSGNNNDWQPNGGITTSSTVTDTPTPYLGGGNYATLNPIWGNSNPPAFSNANLVASPSGSGYNNAISTIAVPASDYWYAEFTATANVPYGGGNNNSIGVVATTRGTLSGSNYIGQSSDTYGYFDGGGLYNNGSISQTVASYVTGDVIMVALGNGKLWWGKNGTWLGTGSPNPATATSPAFSGLSGDYFFGAMTYNSPYGGTWATNFGQRPFAYTPPTGFLPLHTGNLPDSSIVDGSKYFDVALYNNATVVSGLEFAPDMVWHKSRNQAYNHYLYDKVRGVGAKGLNSNSTAAEGTNDALGIVSFDSTGVTYSSDAGLSQTNAVGWFFKANGTGVSNTDGSITSTVSANPTAGFSIVTYTGNGSAGATVGHGLGVAPSFILPKVRSRAGDNWHAYHGALGGTKGILLNATNAASTDAGFWNNTNPSSSVFTVGTYNVFSGQDYVAYCFAEVEGYSKFGSYTGNGSTDGTFVFTGFRPRWLLIKNTTNYSWILKDTARDTYNAAGLTLVPNDFAAESAAGNNPTDFLSNGFKLREGSVSINSNGVTYIYMAFAENPFKNSLAR